MTKTEAHTPDGGPAFAALGVGPSGDVYHERGMSLRDWFAGQVLPAIVAATSAGSHHPMAHQRGVKTLVQAMAVDAYDLADAMLAERSKAEGPSL
jgi:hypothetical protein